MGTRCPAPPALPPLTRARPTTAGHAPRHLTEEAGTLFQNYVFKWFLTLLLHPPPSTPSFRPRHCRARCARLVGPTLPSVRHSGRLGSRPHHSKPTCPAPHGPPTLHIPQSIATRATHRGIIAPSMNSCTDLTNSVSFPTRRTAPACSFLMHFDCN